MSDKVFPEDIYEYIKPIEDDYTDAPWDRSLEYIVDIVHISYSDWDKWDVVFKLEGERSAVSVYNDDGALLLLNGHNSYSGQVEKYLRRVGLLVLLVNNRDFRRKIKRLK